jgi:tRNA threonylcarbamoyladenosine biosynthesis protein TsaB
MERGHQERLAPMAAEVMDHAKLAFADIGKIVTTVGPGSFTGLRVGLAFAKGLHLATGAPLAGIGSLEALAASADPDGQCAGVIDARRGMVYLQAFVGGLPRSEATLLPASEAADRLEVIAPGRWRAAGPGAQLLVGADNIDALAFDAPDLMALGELSVRATPTDDLKPIYLRAPDAKPMPT